MSEPDIRINEDASRAVMLLQYGAFGASELFRLFYQAESMPDAELLWQGPRADSAMVFLKPLLANKNEIITFHMTAVDAEGVTVAMSPAIRKRLIVNRIKGPDDPVAPPIDQPELGRLSFTGIALDTLLVAQDGTMDEVKLADPE